MLKIIEKYSYWHPCTVIDTTIINTTTVIDTTVIDTSIVIDTTFIDTSTIIDTTVIDILIFVWIKGQNRL